MSANKRIAVVAFSAPPYSSGGVASAHYNLHRALLAENFESRMFTFGDDKKVQNQDDIIRSGSSKWWIDSLRFILSFLFKILQAGKTAYQLFDIVSSIPGAIKMNRKMAEFDPHIVILSDHGAPGLFVRRKKGRKIILVSHHNPARFLEKPAPENYSKIDAHLAMTLEERVLRIVDAVICPSNYMKTFFKKSYRYEGPVSVIPNLIDLNGASKVIGVNIRAVLKLDKGSPIVYLPSATSYLKGAEYVPEIIAGLRKIWDGKIAFYLPGNIEAVYQETLGQLAANGDIYLADQVSYAKHIEQVRQCSFCLSPSLMENYSMALLEAALLGLPILAFDTGGNSDIVHQGQNGYLSPLGDLDDMFLHAEQWKSVRSFKKFQKQAEEYSRLELHPKMAIEAYRRLLTSI